MKQLTLLPNQIIALNDSHLYSQDVLKKYFEISKTSQLPSCPVIHKSKGIPYSNKLEARNYNQKFKQFLESHPKAEYFLLDGNHKTTAATLNHKKIPVILIEKDSDFAEIQKLKDEGKIVGWYKIGNSVEEVIKELSEDLFEYYKEDFGFSTIEEKTKKLIKNKEIPKELTL